MGLSRKKLLIACKALISIGLLTWLLSRQDWGLIKENFSKYSPVYIAGVLACYFASQIIAGIRWHITGHALNLPGTRWLRIETSALWRSLIVTGSSMS